MGENLQGELSWKEKNFTDVGYERTAKWLNHINKNLYRYSKLSKMLDADIGDLVSAFENEFTGYLKNDDLRKLRESYLKTVQDILEEALINTLNVRKMFAELILFMYQGVNVSRAITEVGKVLFDLEEQFREAGAYLHLFLFNMHIDGQYFPTLRTLYGLKLAGKGKEIDFYNIQKTAYVELKNELGVSLKPLFVLYEDFGKHLRNAIAHANFIYEGDILTCWDADWRTKKEIWRRDITLGELRYAFVHIYSISDALILWYLIRDTIEKVKKFVE